MLLCRIKQEAESSKEKLSSNIILTYQRCPTGDTGRKEDTMKTYIVTYVNKYNHKEHVCEMRVQAKNLKDAREQFEHKYYDPK